MTMPPEALHPALQIGHRMVLGTGSFFGLFSREGQADSSPVASAPGGRMDTDASPGRDG
jgi:hypothetical protein